MKRIVLLMILGACGSQQSDEGSIALVQKRGVVARECRQSDVVSGYSVYWKFGSGAKPDDGTICKLYKGDVLVKAETTPVIKNCYLTNVEVNGVNTNFTFETDQAELLDIVQYSGNINKTVELTNCTDIEGDYTDYEIH